MNCINIIFKNSSITLPLHFKDYKDAAELQKRLIGIKDLVGQGVHKIEDDYGTVADIDTKDIAGVVLIDLYRELDRQGEIGVMQAKAQQKAQRNFAASPANAIIQPAQTLVN